ncbi:hypothetical protein FOH38_20155 [Lysinibacillus fusiformis]|nr:hypothetical protein FOH38_20155 [Lysinibacillus fusiformis]
METILIPSTAEAIISTSSKGDQSKWRIGEKWIKQNTRGYEHLAEYTVSVTLANSTLAPADFVTYEPCQLKLENNGKLFGCYSLDFRGADKQEVSLERLFEKHYETTHSILGMTTLSTNEKLNQIVEKVTDFTGLDIRLPLTRMLALDAFILNEDRHTNNILFLYDTKANTWELAPLFDHGLSLLSDEKDYPQKVDIAILKRQVKSKPFNASFKKQLALYDGPPFIYKKRLQNALAEQSNDLGRIKELLKMQLDDPTYQKLLIVGDKND